MGVYVHGGKFGDIVFSIPAFWGTGCAEYRLWHSGRVGFWDYRPETILPLLESQGLHVTVMRGGGVVKAAANWVNGDKFLGKSERVKHPFYSRILNLAERHLHVERLPFSLACRPWLHVEPRRVAPVIFIRSPRYRPAVQHIDWRALVAWAGSRGLFMGIREEWERFCWDFDTYLPWLETRDYLHAAEVLAGAELVAANQTGLQAVATALGKPHLLERLESLDCCLFETCQQFSTTRDFFHSIGILHKTNKTT